MNQATKEEVKLHIKVVLNKEKTKVLFAEAGSDFTDVFLSFLLLPLGTIMEVLQKHYGDEAPVIGSLSTLYNGAANLDIRHFRDEYIRKELLTPPSNSCYESESLMLRLHNSRNYFTSSRYGKPYDGVFTKGADSFLISDDLCVLPNVVGSIINTLTTLNIAVAEMDGAETSVAFGLNEIVALLKESLISQNPLTSLVFPQSRMSLAAKGNMLPHQIDQNVTSMMHNKIILKVTLQKSTSKFLFAQADCGFVNFIFHLLVIPLGKVEWRMRSNTGLKNMDNLHRSVAENFKPMHLKSSYIKDLLIKANPFNVARKSYVEGARMYMVSDNLTVTPLGITSSLSVLNELKISMSDVEELELQVGWEDGFSILKAALTSTTALTDGLIKPFLKKKAHQEMEQQIKVEEVSNSASSDAPKKRPKLES